jgi:heme/copper-type cytochrome/quinol oxidase subunit 2
MADGFILKKSTAYLIVLVLVVILAGGYAAMGGFQAETGGEWSGTDDAGLARIDDADNGTSDVEDGEDFDAQDIYIRALSNGKYDKQEITVEKGIPVRLHFTADPDAGCGRQMVIYGMDVRVVSIGGAEDVVEFTPQKAGSYEYNCGMRMWQPGTLKVV